MNDNNDREQRKRASWYDDPFADDVDAIDIRPRRQRGSVSGRPARPANERTQPAARPAAVRQTWASPSPASARQAGAGQNAGSGQYRSAPPSNTRRVNSVPAANTRTVPTANGRSGSGGVGDAEPSRRTTAYDRTPARSDTRTRRSGAHSAGVGRTKRRGGSRSGARSGAKLSAWSAVRRTLLVIFTVILIAVGTLFGALYVIAYGPSDTARSKAVMSAMQASATKWVPGLFLSDEAVDKIIADSKVVVTDVKPITDIRGGGEEHPVVITEDRWEKAIDGMIYEPISRRNFKGYVLLIRDPSRVSVAISDKSFSRSVGIFEIADMYGALAAINGGEFPDNGVQTGANPIGLTYSQGECVWDDGLLRTFIGFTSDNKLYVEENTTRAQAEAAGIRDAVAFQNGNTLITNDGENVTYYYADSNTGVAQRTGIGQLADGTVMFLVTDGRTASSMGATKNDIIDVFAEYGAITAGLLDGGSSAMLYYRDWYTKYNVDQSQLDGWQLMGLVNRYKAFTDPRSIPTFFIVK